MQDQVNKDQPLSDDIRFLGRLLGDTVREQEGNEVFDLVETIRQTAIRFHRSDDPEARSELDTIIEQLAPERAIKVIRAFSYFSHFANIAEDQHHIRRTRSHDTAGSPPRPGTLDHALARAKSAGVSQDDLTDFFNHAHVRPVMTAHPTEVRRKSTMRREMAIADLLDRRGRGDWTPEEFADIDDKLQRAILILWHTNMLRQTRLSVVDEVNNGLSYFDYTFFTELPRLYAHLEDKIAGLSADDSNTVELKPFLQIGSWIGGDRDGNPFVTADVLTETLRRHSAAGINYLLEQVHKLGDELSLSNRLVDVSDELIELAEASPDTSPHREVEPYRRAIAGIYARLAATQRRLNGARPPKKPIARVEPYHTPEQLLADLEIIRTSLIESGTGALT